MFLFYEIAVIPMYLLIGIWGSGPKEYSAMKLTLMLMGGSALLMVGLLGIYFYSAPAGGQLTFNLLEISKITIPIEMQRFLFPFTFIGFGILGCTFPFPYLVARRSCLRSYRCINASRRCTYETRRLRRFPRCHVILCLKLLTNKPGYSLS